MSTTESATRTFGGLELPIPGTWAIDPGHTEVGFVGRHFMLTKVRGRFTSVQGAVTVAEDPDGSAVEVVIDMASVNSGDQTRDDHLRSPDFFDVQRHPTATFTSTAVRWNGTRGTVEGDLTIVGVTRPVTLDIEFAGAVHDPWGQDRAVFSASAQVNREDWGLTWNMALETGGILVSKDIRLEIEVETIRQTAEHPTA
jgi:polyisoprenoid-binding protein YceI